MIANHHPEFSYQTIPSVVFRVSYLRGVAFKLVFSVVLVLRLFLPAKFRRAHLALFSVEMYLVS
jgi:hypothetical protein